MGFRFPFLHAPVCVTLAGHRWTSVSQSRRQSCHPPGLLGGLKEAACAAGQRTESTGCHYPTTHPSWRQSQPLGLSHFWFFAPQWGGAGLWTLPRGVMPTVALPPLCVGCCFSLALLAGLSCPVPEGLLQSLTPVALCPQCHVEAWPRGCTSMAVRVPLCGPGTPRPLDADQSGL